MVVAVVVWSFSCVQLFATPWTAACQASLSFTISWGLFKHMCTESMMPSNHLIVCHPLFLLPSIFSSIRVFPNEWALHIRWLNGWYTGGFFACNQNVLVPWCLGGKDWGGGSRRKPGRLAANGQAKGATTEDGPGQKSRTVYKTCISERVLCWGPQQQQLYLS